MKRIISVVLFLMLLIPISANATTFSVSIDCPATASKGEEITCSVNGTSKNGGIGGISAKYDLGGLSLVSFTPDSAYPTVFLNNNVGFSIGLTGTTGVSGTHRIGVLKLKVPSNSSANTIYKVQLKDFSVSDNKYEDVIVSNVSTNVRVKSDTNTLSNLTVSGGSISFNPATTTYNITLNSSSTTISATKADNNSTITGDIGNKNLNYGNNTFKIKVVSESGLTKEYVININRPDNRSTVNTLSSIKLSSGSINFKENTTSYNVEVANSVSEIKVDATLKDSKAQFVSGYGSRTVKLNVGTNKIEIKVKAENGSTNTYTINVNRKQAPTTKSTVNTLKSIKLSSGTINFKENTLVYNVEVANSVSEIKVDATLKDSKAQFVSGYGSRTVKLNVGLNKVEIKVKAENGDICSYTINITRKQANTSNNYSGNQNQQPNVNTTPVIEEVKLSNNNYLSSIELDVDGFVFIKDKTNYTINVSYEKEKIEVKATAEDSKAEVNITDAYELQVGKNEISITVTAEDKSTREYKIVINRADKGKVLSSNNNIKSIIVEDYELEFNPNIKEYTLKVKEDTLNIKVQVEDNKANYSIVGNENLEDGSKIEIICTSEDKKQNKYVINIEKEKDESLLPISIIIFSSSVLILIIAIIYYKSKKKYS